MKYTENGGFILVSPEKSVINGGEIVTMGKNSE